MNFLDVLMSQEHDSAGRINGVVIGIVTHNADPDNMGRVKVRFPSLSADNESHWARIAAPMAGKDQGLYCLPAVDDEVLVVFEHGNLGSPFVLGALWNGKDAPPDQDGANVKVLKSRSGHIIRLTDTDDKEKIEIIDKSGKNSLVFDTAAKTVTLMAEGTLKLSAKNIEIKADADLKLEGAMVNIN